MGTIKSPTHDADSSLLTIMTTEELIARCQRLRAERDRYREGYDRRGRQLAELRVKHQRMRSRMHALSREETIQ